MIMVSLVSSVSKLMKGKKNYFREKFFGETRKPSNQTSSYRTSQPEDAAE